MVVTPSSDNRYRLISVLPPYAFVLLGVRRGRFTDRHLSDRRQRILPICLGLLAAVVGAIALALAGAPKLLLFGIETTGAGLVVGGVITRFWKISGHTLAAGVVLVVCAGLWHGWPLLAAPVLVLVGWARVRLKDHTVAQVIAGAATGSLIAGLMLATPAWPALAGLAAHSPVTMRGFLPQWPGRSRPSGSRRRRWR